MKNIIISIDGPAGSGKERIAKYIAKKYDLFHLDSGIIYRRLAHLILIKQIDTNNLIELKAFLKKLKPLSIRRHKSLRTEKISKISSKIASNALVRKFIDKQQKIIVKNLLLIDKGAVIDGRDIGSKVFKNAKIKLFVDLDVKIRAKRRYKQLIELGEKSIYPQILKEIKLRDKLDTKRKFSPLVIPKGAIIINNSLNFQNTIKQINIALKKI